MILIIDNYDSFVHNLARYISLSGCAFTIVRNDEMSVQEIEDMAPDALVISPGPCAPVHAGICVEAIRSLGHTLPILGVCLGHQCIGEAYGAPTIRAPEPVHGQSTQITHRNSGLFSGLPSPMEVGRYHSLAVEWRDDLPLIPDAETKDGQVMALHHEQYPVYGVQFHPESILTRYGMEIVKNFKTIVETWHKDT